MPRPDDRLTATGHDDEAAHPGQTDQSEGRRDNAASPGGKPTPDTPEKDVKRVGRESTRRAGPDGPGATEVGDTFKR